MLPAVQIHLLKAFKRNVNCDSVHIAIMIDSLYARKIVDVL